MLYLDSSALVKHYVQEAGTEKLEDRRRIEEAASRQLFTSVLTFAEIHATLARRMQDKSLSTREFIRARKKFDSDWALRLSPIDLAPAVLGIVRDVVAVGLRSADAVHLASAVWLRGAALLGLTSNVKGVTVTFVTSDEKLAEAAQKKHFEVFNPRTAP